MHHIASFVATAAICIVTATAQTVHLAGDSTMANSGNNDGTRGWGAFLPDYISLNVDNKAVAGESARSFTREGRFTAMAAAVQQGDYVVMEFGHNDVGTLSPDNGHTTCNPTNGYATTCQTTYNGVAETVLTTYTYLVRAAALFKSKGASVIISSPTPNNLWEGGSYSYSPSRYITYARDAAAASGSVFVDHQSSTAKLYKDLGSATVNSFYPYDHIHTSPAGANAVARAFVLAVEASGSGLKRFTHH